MRQLSLLHKPLIFAARNSETVFHRGNEENEGAGCYGTAFHLQGNDRLRFLCFLLFFDFF
jgi:hypothetical protein